MYFDWTVLERYWPGLMIGLRGTLLVVVIVLAAGSVIGVFVAGLNLSPSRTANRIGRAYVNVFRNVPEMALIFWSYFCLPQILELRMSAFLTGTLALALVAGANLGEIFRGGFLAVPRGQREAATALGLRPLYRLAFVIGPQALRRMTGPVVNYLTEVLKQSTLLSAIGVTEIAHSATTLGSQTFRYLEFFSAIGVLFFVIIFPLSVIGRRISRLNAKRLGT